VRAMIEGFDRAGEIVTLRLRDSGERVSVPLIQARDATLAVDWGAGGRPPRRDADPGAPERLPNHDDDVQDR
jgi:hypothetical protein